MSYTRTQMVANVREVMDATSSARWSDTYIKTVLGYVFGNEWSSLLGAQPYYRFQQVTATTDASGQVAISSLNTGSGDTAQTAYRVLAVTDGNSVVYRETTFQAVPLAATSNYVNPYERLWYRAGSKVQILPVQANVSVVFTTNWTPTPIDQLASDSSTIDFPAGHEVILWLMAGAELLMKGGAEVDAANTLIAQANRNREQLYQDITRMSARPLHLAYPDTGAEWAGAGMLGW